MKAPEMNKELANYNQIPEGVEWNPDKGWETFCKKITASNGPQLLIKWIAIAASVVLIFGTTYFFQIKPKQWYTNVSSSIQELDISNELKLVLNKDAKIAYHAKKRVMHLSGQAQVSVNESSDITFVVGKDSLMAKQAVFFVWYNHTSQQQIVHVESGQLIYKANNYALKVEAGEVLNNTNDMLVFIESIANTNYKAWLNKEFVFDDMPLFLVMDQLQQVFQFDYNYADKETKYCLINGSYSGESIQEIVKQIPQDKHLEIRINNNQLTIAGPGC